MTTKEKRAAEAALKRKEQLFKKMVGLCAYECKVMRSELLEVIDYGGGEFIKEKEKVDATSWNWLRCVRKKGVYFFVMPARLYSPRLNLPPSRNGSNGLADCSREQILNYKSAFSPDQWEGMMKTWEIVEDRAR